MTGDRIVRAAEASIPLAPRDRPLPLSFDQEGRLALEAMQAGRSGTAPHHLVRGVRFSGRVDTGILRAALAAVVGRHEALRTGFAVSLPAPGASRPSQHPAAAMLFRQVIRQHASVPVTEPNLADIPPAERDAVAIRAATDLLHTPFDHTDPPLLRAVIATVAPESHLLFLIMHHLVADEWSIQIVKRELMFFYRHLVSGRAHSLPPLRRQYVDFAAWQRSWLASDRSRPASQYWVGQWRQFGQELLRCTDLPFYRPRDSAASLRATRFERLTIPPTLVDAMRAHARLHAVTPFMMSLAALFAVLHGWTGKTTVAVMGHFANRVRPAVDRVVGWFANAHLLGVECVPAASLARLLADVRRTLLEAYAYQEVPLGYIWTHLRAGSRPLAASHAHDLYLSIDFVQREALAVDGIRLDPAPIAAPAAMTSLRLVVLDSADAMMISCSYSSDVFAARGVCDLLANLVRVLETLVSQPDVELGAVADGIRHAPTGVGL